MARSPVPTKPGVSVVRTSYSDFEARVRDEVERYGMSLEEFVRAGRNDDLEEPELRELWLRSGPILR